MTIRNALEELLLIVEIHQKSTKNNFAWAEVEYAKQLLAQHQLSTEQEPVAWRWKTHKRDYYIYSEENYHELEGEPLYTSSPKRKSLSDDEIEQTTKNMSQFAADMFKAGIRAAEKAHGIGFTDEH